MFIAYSEACPVMYLRPFKRHRIRWQSNHFGLHKWYELWFIFVFILVPLCVTMFYFLILGRYDLHLPNLLCRLCLAHWTPDMSDLISSGYWPASCFTLVVVLLNVKLTEHIMSDTEHIFFLILSRSEEPYFDGTFIAKDTDVHHFVDEIRSKIKSVSKISCFFAPLIYIQNLQCMIVLLKR